MLAGYWQLARFFSSAGDVFFLDLNELVEALDHAVRIIELERED